MKTIEITHKSGGSTVKRFNWMMKLDAEFHYFKQNDDLGMYEVTVADVNDQYIREYNTQKDEPQPEETPVNAPVSTATMNPLFPTREAYLTEAANLILDDLIMPVVEKWNASNASNTTMIGTGYERPVFRISVGFPKHSRGGKAIASCFSTEASSDGVNEIFINPEIDQPLKVMEAVAHELVHAIDDLASGHQNFFAHTARKIGLEGKLTETFAGSVLMGTLREYEQLLGAFPHHKMVMDKTHKKDSTRQLKVECGNSDCGFLFRSSAKQIAKLGGSGVSLCPACQRGRLNHD